MNIVVLDADSIGHDISLDSWKAYGDVTLYGLTKYEEIPERIKDADIVMTNKCHLDEKALKDAKNVKFIAELATGYNNIDIEYCKAHGIAVANVGGYSTMTVVQHTFALSLSMNENFHIILTISILVHIQKARFLRMYLRALQSFSARPTELSVSARSEKRLQKLRQHSAARLYIFQQAAISRRMCLMNMSHLMSFLRGRILYQSMRR